MTSFIDYFIPDTLDDDSGIERKRARIAVITALFFLIWGPIVTALYWVGGSVKGAIGVAVCTCLVATFPFVLRSTGKLNLAGHIIVLPLYGLLMWLVFLLGGLSAPPLSWLMLAPIFAMLFQGTRTAIVWLVVVVLSWSGIAIAQWSGYVFDQQFSTEFLEILRVIEVVGLCISVFIVILLKDGLQDWLVGQVRQKEAETRAVLETAPDGILTVAPDGEVLSANQAAARVFGRDYGAVAGRQIGELVATLDAEALAEAAVSADFGQTQEHTGRRGAEVFPAEIAFGSLSVDQGVDRGSKQDAVVLVLRDITQRKDAEADLMRARDEALEASRAKSAFLANMSHELRTPLNAVIGYSEMILEEIEFMDDGDETAAQFVPDLERIRTAGKHLLAIINDILDLSKIEAGKMVTHVELFDIGELLDDIVGTLQPLADKHGNTVRLQVDDGLNLMRSDLTKVRQILFNLMSNACKFTSEGTVELRAAFDQANQQVIFEVEDTGVGMSAEQLDEVFEAFTQADASTTREFGGTGLGLTITSHFCAMLDGEIDVESTPGQGSTFTVRLAADLGGDGDVDGSAVPDFPDDGGSLSEPSTAFTEPAFTKPAPSADADTVLVVDDDPTMRDLLRRVLEREGYHVATAASGSEGLLLAEQLEPDVITLDVMMPAMDGWSLLAKLKENPTLAAIPVVMITIVAESGRGYALGADHYLVKPVDRAKLVEILEACSVPNQAGQMQAGEKQAGEILLVEDDEPTRSLISRLLRRDGWKVVEAENGQVGLDKLDGCDPSLVLLDLMMPTMDGFEFLRHFRDDPAYRDVPVVVVTAKELTEEDEARLSAGVSEVLAKGGREQDKLLDEVREQVRKVTAAASRV